ncbi:MAG: dienelactone hydrolase family protein [Clostridia bacterium]|nr:dienelactone hydrolase family protein [Clostridia bacterium]
MLVKTESALVAVIMLFLSLFGVSFTHREDNMAKIYQSEYRSPGGNAKTDELKALFAPVKERTPTLTPCPEKDPYPGDSRVKAVYFDGEECRGRAARVFAYIGFPEGASSRDPVPAMVLVHGGGAHAYAEWVRYWVDSGYAAISPDCFGQKYIGEDNTYHWEPEYWTVDPESHLPIDGFASKDKPFEEQWFRYFISDIILSNNIMRADSRVIKDKIGLTGISWGGFAASVAVCYDERFAFAAPVYGSGFQSVSRTVWGEVFRGEGVSDVWDAENLLGEVAMPVTWFNSDHDPFFSADSAAASAAAAQNGAVTFIPDYTHGMIEGGEQPEILRFANEQTGMGEGNVRIDAISFENGRAVVSFTLPADADLPRASVVWRRGPLEYKDDKLIEEWKTERGAVLGGRANIRIPACAEMFYVLIEGKVKNVKVGGIFDRDRISATSGIFTRAALEP